MHALRGFLYNVGSLLTPEGLIGTESSSAQLPLPADIQSDEPAAAVSLCDVEQSFVSADGEHAPAIRTMAHMPGAGSQGAAPACTPQHHADVATGGVAAETPTKSGPSSESSRHAALPVCSPEHRPGAHGEGPSVETPVPAGVASDADGQATASVKTPLPGPSPKLPAQSDLVTPPAQILDDAEVPEVDASHDMQQDTPDEVQKESTQQEVQSTSMRLCAVTRINAFHELHQWTGAHLPFTVESTKLRSALALGYLTTISDVWSSLQANHEEGNATEVSSYVARGKRTPFMERKLRALQAGYPK